MPPCPLAWLPQQIAAPRRNQTNDSLEVMARLVPLEMSSTRRGLSPSAVCSTDRLVVETTHLSMGRTTEAAPSRQIETGGVCRAQREMVAKSASERRTQDRSRRSEARRLA